MELDSEKQKMEMSNSEALFESLNLSPQIFINEVRNAVDDLIDDAFAFFREEASRILKIEGSERSAALSKGVDYVRDLVSLTVEQRMQKWEEYCFHFCFSVPEGFSIPNENELSSEYLPHLNALIDEELDEELTSLHEKLAKVRKETSELTKELHSKKRQLLPNNQSGLSFDEELLMYDKNGANEAFQELATLASELHAKVGILKRKSIEEIQCDRAKMLNLEPTDIPRLPFGTGGLAFKLQEVEQFLSHINPS